ncbi:MAG: acyl-CoA dehydrogenase family protein [Deltaproteobacteria bacterium]|nr:acyl-CoA dehydrogenase family protein [Deltaproteobacteria bacterium]
MDFSFSEEHDMFRKTVSDFAKKEFKPIVPELDEKGEWPMDLYRKVGKLGFVGLRFPEKYGGAGAGVIMECIFTEEMSKVEMGFPGGILSSALAITSIYHHGTEEQKEKYVIPTNRGEKLSAIAITEPNAGSDVASIACKAVKDGNSYVINGTKMFISNSPVADFLVVAVKTDKDKKHRGISLIVVEKGTPGLKVNKLNVLGSRLCERGEIVLEDCRVPTENLIGEENKGFYYIMETFDHERILIGATCVGIAQGAFDEALEYAKQREQFGQPIGKFQGIQFMLADMAVEIEAARLLTYKGAWMADQGMEMAQAAAFAKLYAGEMANRVCYKATQIHGGYGYSMEFPVQRHARDARLLSIGGGTSQIQQNIIARLLGL